LGSKAEEQDIAKAVELFRQGKNPNTISKETGIAPQIIMKQIMKAITPEERNTYRNNILNKKPLLKEKVDKILELKRNNPAIWSTHQISEILGISQNEVRRILEIFLD
jgi:hypothetical protein